MSATRDAQLYITRQNWLALRLFAHDQSKQPEEIVDEVLTRLFTVEHPDVMARVEAYQQAKTAAWREAEKGAQTK